MRERVTDNRMIEQCLLSGLYPKKKVRNSRSPSLSSLSSRSSFHRIHANLPHRRNRKNETRTKREAVAHIHKNCDCVVMWGEEPTFGSDNNQLQYGGHDVTGQANEVELYLLVFAGREESCFLHVLYPFHELCKERTSITHGLCLRSSHAFVQEMAGDGRMDRV